MIKRFFPVLLAFVLAFLDAAVAEETAIDYLALVNKLNPLPEGWEEALDIVSVTNSLGDEVKVERTAYEAYLQLKAALEGEDVHIDLDSAYRSVAEQEDIVVRFTAKYGEDYVRQYVAVPGYSEHHTGLALDLYLNIDGEDVYLNEDMVQYPEIWAKIHAALADYGFILRYLEGKEEITGYSYEPWHIRYVGPDAAKEIAERGITLEEYLINYDTFMTDLVKSYEEGTGTARIEADAAILNDDVAPAIVECWKKIYLDPEYKLNVYGTDDPAELDLYGVHAFVVLGFQLKDGEMTEELMGRCDAAAAAAKAFPDSILVCSGGATGDNNPEGHTEAGLMKDYLVEQCGIEADRIFIDEAAMTTAENAINTFRILREQGIETITIVTSSYHQRSGQTLYNSMAARYQKEYG